MMFFKTILPAFVTLIYASKVAPQITAALPWIPDDGPDGDLSDFSDDDHLASGLILGTGSNGETTYLLTMLEDDDNNRPITAILVADAAGATVLGAYSDKDNDDDDDDADDLRSEFFSIGCGIQSRNAVCTYQRVGVLGSSTFTSVTTRTAAADTITVVASTGTAPSAAPTASGSGSSSAASTRSGSATASGATATQSSGALENAAAGLFAGAVPLVLAAFAMA